MPTAETGKRWHRRGLSRTKVDLRNREPLVRTITPDRLRNVSSEHGVIALVSDYLSEWLPEELAQLPHECRPVRLHDGEDLGGLAVSVARAYNSFDLEPESMRAVEEMDAFVGPACRRLAELRHLEQATRLPAGSRARA